MKIQFLDQKLTLEVENRKFSFSTKIDLKIVPRDLKSISGRKITKLTFLPKK